MGLCVVDMAHASVTRTKATIVNVRQAGRDLTAAVLLMLTCVYLHMMARSAPIMATVSVAPADVRRWPQEDKLSRESSAKD